MAIWLDAPALLMEYRLHPERWSELACHDGQNSKGMWRDEHAAARYHMLIALQYHHQIEDENLIHFLFQQEVIRHQQEPFQGYDSHLELTTYLLARYRNVAYVWDFYEAKRANFDTFMGYSSVVLVSAGIEETLAYIRATDHPLQSDLQKMLIDGQACVYTGGDVRQWWEKQSAKFPQTETDETAETMVKRARFLEDRDAVRYWSMRWRETDPVTANMRYYLVHYVYPWLKEWDTAISIQKESIADEKKIHVS